jgi:hypothetical protein
VTAAREAVGLPLLFLSVTLAGAIRPGADVLVVPPGLASLVVAIVLFGLLVRSGALAPEALVNPSRPALANANGVTVLLSLIAASAQVVTLVVPESGMPALVVWVALSALLVQAFAVAPDRVRMLRALLVTFGAAFALKFIVLASLSAPAEGRLARTLQVLFEGLTLGAVSQRPLHPAEGYLALATLVLYLIGVAILPAASWQMIRVARGEPIEAAQPHALVPGGRELSAPKN